MKVISANIRFDNPKDSHPWPQRKLILAQLIIDFSPFVLGTQEGREGQLGELAELLPSYRLVDRHRSWIEERMYPCLFLNNDHLRLILSGDFWLSETPYVEASKSFGSAFPRLCTWVVCQNKEEQRFFIANVHLDHMQTETRQEQARVLCQEIKSLNTDSYPIILMGDFNEGPDGEVRKIIMQYFPDFIDGWESLSQIEETSFHKFEGKLEDGSRIDWILTSSHFNTASMSLDKRSEDEIYPSDHFPVLGEFKL